MGACTNKFTQLDNQQPKRARATPPLPTSTDMIRTSTDRLIDIPSRGCRTNSHRLEAALSQERTPKMRYHPRRKPTSRPKLQNNANSQFIRTDLAKPAEIMVEKRAGAKVRACKVTKDQMRRMRAMHSVMYCTGQIFQELSVTPL